MRHFGGSNRSRIGAAGVVLALSGVLGGCAAAVVVPMLAAGTMVATNSRKDRRPEEQSVAVVVETDEPAPQLVSQPTPQAALVAPAALVPTRSSVTVATQLSDIDEWRAFVDYALGKSRVLGGPEPVESALLVTGSRLERPDRLPCRSSTPAVILDLDQGTSAFSPSPSAQPVAGLAEGLAQLRAEGVVVMWVSAADANRVTPIGEALRSSGLDPAGKDPLLLIRNGEQRKQVLRDDANRSVCIIAMAGDRRSDFDELFDYLRDPSAAAGLDTMLGDGWFIVRPPLDEAPPPVN